MNNLPNANGTPHRQKSYVERKELHRKKRRRIGRIAIVAFLIAAFGATAGGIVNEIVSEPKRQSRTSYDYQLKPEPLAAYHAVPEPLTGVLLGAGGAAVLLKRRRRKHTFTHK